MELSSKIFKDNEPIVSIVVICFNSESFILETLESVKNQIYHNLELIISDDYSTDSTMSLCEDWLNKNSFRFINSKILKVVENTGITANCNRGISQCTGEYTKILAGDDILHKNYVQSCISFLKENTDYNVVFTNTIYIDENSKELDLRIKTPLPEGDLFENLLFDNFIPAPSAIVRSTVYTTFGLYDENLKIEDWDMWLKIAKESKIEYINEPLVYYRIHSNNFSNNPKMIFDEWEILMKYEDDGKYSNIVNRFVIYRFINHQYRMDLQKKYIDYKHKNYIIYYYLKYNFPKRLLIWINLIFKLF